MVGSRSRVVVVALVSLLVIALAAAPARASKFQAEEYVATVSGSQLAKETAFFTFGAAPGNASCVTYNLTGTLAAASEAITLHPTFKGACAVFGDAKGTVTTTGCDFKIHAGALLGGSTYDGTVDIVCSVGSSIKFTGETCAMEVKSVNGLATVELINGGFPADLTVKSKLTSVPYTVTTDGAMCPLPGVGNYTNGTFGGNATVTATSTGGATGLFVN